MAKKYTIQQSFAAGQVSKRLGSQIKSEVYQAGVAELTNFMTLSQGPVQRRENLKYWGLVPGKGGRLFGFPITSNSGCFVCVSGDGNVYLVSESGTKSSNELVQNSDFNLGTNHWSPGTATGGYVISNRGYVRMQPGRSPYSLASIEQTITVSGLNDIELRIGCLETSYSPMLVMVSTSSAVVLSSELTYLKDYYRVINVQGFTNLRVTVSIWGGDTSRRRDVNYISVKEYNPLAMYGSTLADLVKFPHPWDAGEISRLQVNMSPIEDTMFFTCPTAPPQELNYDSSNDIFSFSAVSFVGSTPTSWTGDNWPGVQCFYQGRWWIGGTANEPESFWGSRSGVFRDFKIPTHGTDDSDPMSWVVAKKGRIRWMHGDKTLLIGTDLGEFNIISEGPILVIGDIQGIQQSTYGSKSIQAEPVGNKVLYVSGDGRKVREIGYKWTDEGWISRDLTFIAEDITEGVDAIADLLYARNPYDQVLAITEDHNIIGATYEKEKDILGWYEYDIGGIPLAISFLELQGTSKKAVLVDRETEDVTHPSMSIEVFDTGYGFDCSCIQYNVEKTNIIKRASQYLSNNMVEVKIDGAVYGSVALNMDGDTVLTSEGNVIEIGYPYVAYLKSLPITPDTQVGTSAPLHRRFNKIYARVVSSAKPRINDNLSPVRHPSTPMDEPEALYTEDVGVINLGWDRLAQIEVTQGLPYFTMVTGLHGEEGVEVT